MNSTWIIARRELKSYFDSPVAYIVVFFFLLLAGWMFFATFFLQELASMRTFFEPNPLLHPGTVLVIIVPALTMRLIAEERRRGTIELLTTLPISDWSVVLGKFLAAFGLVAIALGLTFVYALTVAALGDLDWGPVITGYLGYLLFSGALVAIGLLCSTLTENQIVAFILAFVIGVSLWLINWLSFFAPGLGAYAQVISLSAHLDKAARGLIDLRDLLFFLSVIFAGLFLSERQVARQHA